MEETTNQQLLKAKNELPEGFQIVKADDLKRIIEERRVFMALLNEVVPVLEMLTPGDEQLGMLEVMQKLAPAFAQLKESRVIQPLGKQVIDILKRYNAPTHETTTLQLGDSGQ